MRLASLVHFRSRRETGDVEEPQSASGSLPVRGKRSYPIVLKNYKVLFSTPFEHNFKLPSLPQN